VIAELESISTPMLEKWDVVLVDAPMPYRLDLAPKRSSGLPHLTFHPLCVFAALREIFVLRFLSLFAAIQT
jgi:hypothetical protein